MTEQKGARMIETVVSIDLFVDEKLEIIKNRLLPDKSDDTNKRLCIVTGIHGDELEGQFVCYEILRRIKEHPEYLTGILDIYPSLNPLGLDSISRKIPMFDLDMNRIFPGLEDGAIAELIASRIVEDIEGATMCLDIHSSNIFLREIPQVRMSSSYKEQLLNYAKMLNVQLVWIDSTNNRQEATLAQTLNDRGTPTLVTEMGSGMRITKSYGLNLVDGIFSLMSHLGIWTGETAGTSSPLIAKDDDIQLLHAETPGIFMPEVGHFVVVKKGDLIGSILDPLNGVIKAQIFAPCDGTIFTLREYPVVYGGSLLARILGGGTHA